jgi:hypothetical protein
MKHNLFLVTCVSTALLTAGFVTGCASDNYHKGADTAAALNHSADLIAKSGSQIDDSLAALNDLLAHPQPDLRGQYQAFVVAVDHLGATAGDVADKNKAMRVQGADYFAGWDHEIALMQNEDIRNRSEARRIQVAAKFDHISQQYDAVSIAFQPYMSDLRDVQKYLSTDLTSGGLSAIREIAAKTTRDAVPLKESLTLLSEQFKGLGVSMSATTATAD